MKNILRKFFCLVGIHSYMYGNSITINNNVWGENNAILFIVTHKKCQYCDKIKLYKVLEY